MKKIPKPQRARRGKKYIGNWFIKDPVNGAQINLGTKNATEALERAKEFAATGKRNFQDDLDGAAEATLAAVEGAAPPATAAQPIEQPPPPVREPPAAVAPPPAPTATPAPEAAPTQTPTPVQQSPVNKDWRDDARAAAEQAAATSDAAAPQAPEQQLDPNMIEQFLKTGAGFMFEGQLFMQAKIAEWGTGEKPPALIPTLERAVKAGQMPEEAVTQVKTVKDLSIAGYTSFLKRKIDVNNLPDWAVGLIAAGSLSSIQFSMAAVIKKQKADAKKRNGATSAGMPPGTPAAPPPPGDETGVGADAL